MFYENIPLWLLVTHYSFLFFTYLIATSNFSRKKVKYFSLLTLISTFTLPLAIIFQALNRGPGLNEYEYIVIMLKSGSKLSMYIVLCHLLILVFWVVFISVFIREKK
ncbi:hypothetical protein [Chengkuizengella axinellae]|uniref:Uncharacterized protein n=1 Tax=Chengkuizengella axinellae TaxID=3064388 RepID=A0ABT9IY22_9BACL|nr:hypothetical protein [Chengkuizengella sp. 2205SS18-9]MDP5274022.1 hypothetical protein [Chengkuizengella sp. 2205SS18-9]